MYSFKELRKASKLKMDGEEIRVAILGNCSTQFLAMAVEGYAKLSSLKVKIYDADYNQIEVQLRDAQSEVYGFRPTNIILWMATEKLYEEFMDLPLTSRNGFADAYLNKIQFYWSLIEQFSSAKILQMNFTEIDDKILGQYSAKIDQTFIYQIRKLNWLLEEAMSLNHKVYPVDLLSVQIQLGQAVFFDAPFYYSSKISVSTKALPYVAKAIVDILKSINGKIKKCVILDLDNTLWGGVIGDDGMDHIEIGELGRGHVFVNLQRWLKDLRRYGILLAVCSKNDEDIAKEPFEKHEEMVLRMEDIAIFVANWKDKVTNIQMIQNALNIGMDSLVFIDDNPFERNLVREMLPDIEVPELPEDPADYLGYLQQGNYFDTVSYFPEMEDRTKQYQAEFARKKAEINSVSIESYLKQLEMVGTVKRFEQSKYSRIAQLTQRSNQFNLRTVRYTEDDIGKIAEKDDDIGLYFTLKDKYGDYGVVAVVIMKKRSEHELFIDSWIMSCRVLKRGMEEFVMNQVIGIAREMGFILISAEYIPTPKNKLVKDLYAHMGFDTLTDNQFVLRIDRYTLKKTYILEGN